MENSANKLNFTKDALRLLPLPPAGQRVTYYDTKEPALQIRVTSTGKKTFSVLKRIKSGPPERVTIGPFPDVSIEQARTRAGKIKSEMAAGESPASEAREKRGELTLGEAFEMYIRDHAIPEKLKGIDELHMDFQRYLGEVPDVPAKKHGKKRTKTPGSVNWQNKRLSAIKTAHVVQLKTALFNGSGAGAANHAIKLIRQIYNKLDLWKIYKGENPAEKVPLVKIRSRDRFLTKEELPRLFEALAESENIDARDYILLALLTGGRKSNVVAMRWDEILFDEAEWHIPDTKNGESQIVQLPAEAIMVLESRRNNGSEWVFPGSGKTGHMVAPKKGVATIFKSAGIENIRIHDLRRTLGSWQAILGSSLAIIGKSLGHKSLAATQIYARLSSDPVRESVERATTMMLEKAGVKEAAKILEFKKKAKKAA